MGPQPGRARHGLRAADRRAVRGRGSDTGRGGARHRLRVGRDRPAGVRHGRPGGSVTGADVSAPLLAAARARPVPAGAAPVAWIEADVETHPFLPATFDAALSRFGTMFFADTQAAFANIRAALKPAGQLTLLCWQAMAANPG
ncbi:class I SAM-dependent methyltransferase [Methylobacterium gregans]|uniref:class I SAM-dependent methyltransferase n=1 Tax=Methylobacterium gregans TaxID=374424 RepID=UPI00361A1D7C